jgi:hypothetical protein
MADQYPELDVEIFLSRFPEFQGAGPLIEQALADQTLMVSKEVFGTRYELAVHYLAADWLTNHSYGRSQRSEERATPSRYRVMYDNPFNQVRINFAVT